MLRATLIWLSQNVLMRKLLLSLPFSHRVSRRFVAGETLKEAIAVCKALNKKGFSVTLDHLGEFVKNKRQAEKNAKIYCNVLEAIHRNKLDAQIGIKLSAIGMELGYSFCKKQFEKILRVGKKYKIVVECDMEDSSYVDRTLKMYVSLKKKYPLMEVAIQAYLFRSLDDVKELVKVKPKLRLVKGAYLESDGIAYQNHKAINDNFVKIVDWCWKNNKPVFFSMGTHNDYLIRLVKQLSKKYKIPKNKWEFEMLYGIRNKLQRRLLKDYPVRVYLPYGEQWYPYFMRRLAERPANLWWLVKNIFK